MKKPRGNQGFFMRNYQGEALRVEGLGLAFQN